MMDSRRDVLRFELIVRMSGCEDGGDIFGTVESDDIRSAGVIVHPFGHTTSVSSELSSACKGGPDVLVDITSDDDPDLVAIPMIKDIPDGNELSLGLSC